MTVLIPNCGGKDNIGDLALTHMAILAAKRKGAKEVVLHSFDPEKMPAVLETDRISPSFYYWALFEHRHVLIRCYRLGLVLIALLLPTSVLSYFPSALKRILYDYQQADLIMFQGGGYLRSQKGITQQLNVLILLLHLAICRKFSKRVIMRPLSFGPFHSSLLQYMCALFLGMAEIVYVRDPISYELLSSYGLHNLTEKEDDALSLSPVKTSKRAKRTLGFTVREWPTIGDYHTFVHSFASLLSDTLREQSCVQIQPVYFKSTLLCTRKLTRISLYR